MDLDDDDDDEGLEGFEKNCEPVQIGFHILHSNRHCRDGILSVKAGSSQKQSEVSTQLQA
eukprot:10820551-Ditylum_brightwellii.AAC.1